MTSFASVANAEAILNELAGVFFRNSGAGEEPAGEARTRSLNVEARYRAIVEQIPAVVFMAYLDEGIGEAYVSPQIEATLGFSQREWLEDPIRWYQQIHPDDKQRWSMEAAEMFLSGNPLRSAYRVMSRDGRVIWFHCEAKMMRRADGRPWFIHGVAFDISELKRAEEELQEERDVLSAILQTVGALVVVLDPSGRIVRFNRACEQTTGYSFAEVQGERVWNLFLAPEDRERFQARFDQLLRGSPPQEEESYWLTRDGDRRLIRWSATILPGAGRAIRYVIASGTDVTERKLLERAILEISGREQRRIGQDLHDGLGQHLTGIAFMTKVQEQRLAERSRPEAADAAKIVRLVNEAIHKTRELARGLLPVQSDALGLMSALQHFASEVEDLFQVSCRFECEETVLVADEAVANHLYRIAQEAVHNAIKHGRAGNVVIVLRAAADGGILSVTDDGVGIADPAGSPNGMGLQIMRYRVSMIGGALEIVRCPDRGTLVRCAFPGKKME
jgi:PAS domain S-box-containing protein